MKRLIFAAAMALAACSGSADEEEGTDTSDATSAPFELYFTNPLPDLIARGDVDAAALGELARTKIASGPEPDKRLVSLIDSAKGKACSVLLADFDYNLQPISDALVRAKARGCDVRVVTDGDTVDRANASTVASQRYGRHGFDSKYQAPLDTLFRANVPVHDDGSRGAIMHNKFVVINGTTVWTGSWNMSAGDLAYWNHAIVLRSPDIAARYTQDFEYLFKRYAPAHAPGSHLLDATFTPPQNHKIMFGTRPVEVYFPRADKATARIAEVVGQASRSIHFMAFQFTEGPIADAVVERAAHGVQVRGVFENNGACAGAYPRFLSKGTMDLSRWSLGRIQGLRNFLHHKVFILDGATVVLGSFNFSASADTANDENVLIITDPDIAKAFEDEYVLVENATKRTHESGPCKPRTTNSVQ